jgi:hypothetical protein
MLSAVATTALLCAAQRNRARSPPREETLARSRLARHDLAGGAKVSQTPRKARDWRERRRPNRELRAREENGSDSRRPEHNASGRQRCRNSRVKRLPLSALKGSLDRVLPAMPVVDERHTEQRIADAEQLIRPGGAARELRYEFAGGKADRECRQTAPPPREVCALGREPCATCCVFNFHARIKPRLGPHISICGRCGRFRRAPPPQHADCSVILRV